MKVVVAVCSTITFIVLVCIFVARWYGFNSQVGDNLKLAGESPTIEKADYFLGKALESMQEKGLTEGNSAFIFRRPKTDVGIWFQQIQGAKETTARILAREADSAGSVAQLEKDNALMKIREVLLDHSSEGTKVTTPPNISWYPYHWLLLVLLIFSVAGGLVGWFLVYCEYC